MFRDRDDAGRQLADRLVDEGFERPLVLGLPRGGIPVAAHVASALHAELAPFVARKVGAPGQPEFGIGAVAEGSDDVVVGSVAGHLGVDQAQLRALANAERAELRRRVEKYRGGRPLPDLGSRDVILVDDGLATGVTAEAALRALRSLGPRRLVLAVPVCSPDTANRLAGLAEIVSLAEPPALQAIGIWYEDFTQVSDEEVLDLLASAAPGGSSGEAARAVTLDIPGGGVIEGDLSIPDEATGVVLFAHGSGSSRHSPRNRRVAATLRRRGLATMLTDLLTEAEDELDATTGRLRFDIDLLATRLQLVADWLATEPGTARFAQGYFGASTGGAAALVAAARSPRWVQAVVSRGGRPDLAGDLLADVRAPTLLIVGGRDDAVIGLNRAALDRLTCERDLVVVPGATHLFEEPGALDEVADLAADWFGARLRAGSTSPGTG